MKTFSRQEAVSYAHQNGVKRYRLGEVQVEVLLQEKEWVSENGSPLLAKKGDILITFQGRIWSCEPDVFYSCYKQNVNGSWSKTEPVLLTQISEEFTVKTLEGPSTGKAGDYLACNITDDVWPIPQLYVNENYSPVN